MIEYLHTVVTVSTVSRSRWAKNIAYLTIQVVCASAWLGELAQCDGQTVGRSGNDAWLGESSEAQGGQLQTQQTQTHSVRVVACGKRSEKEKVHRPRQD